MMDFLSNLYQNDNFTLYLTIILVVLVILFVVVLIFGKKDQKLEETKRLQKIELEGFKEEKTEPVKVEVNTEPEVKEEVTTLEDKKDDEINVTTFEPVAEEPKEVVSESQEKEEATSEFEKDGNPIFSAVEESTLNIPDYDLGNLESALDEIPEAVPNEDSYSQVDEEEPVLDEPILSNSNPQVFSSVFVNSDASDKSNNEEQKISMFAMDDDEDTIELPTLKVEKEEVKEETPLVKEEESTISFADIEGETYNLK